jgi:hypothetical protein
MFDVLLRFRPPRILPPFRWSRSWAAPWAAYASLPARLIACTSPLQFWAEYFRFGQRLFSGFQVVSHDTRSGQTSIKRITRKATRR